MEPNPTGAPWDPPASAIAGAWSVPWMIQALAVIFILTIAAQAAPRFLGPLQQTVEAFVNGQRRTKTAERDADVSALRDQVDTLQHLLEDTRDDVRALLRAQDTHYHVLQAHALWDQAMIRAVIESGGRPPPRPPLWPDEDNHSAPTGHA